MIHEANQTSSAVVISILALAEEEEKKMSLVLNCTSISSSSSSSIGHVSFTRLSTSSLTSAKLKMGKKGFRVRSFIFNPTQECILNEALKEPVAFMGGVFAGLLRLDLNEDPLKEWVTKTVEAAGITQEELNVSDVQQEETPQEIEIQ